MSMQHRLPDQAVSSWTLFCTECFKEMKMTKAAAVATGRQMRTYVCACGHSERVTVNVAVAEVRSGAGYTSFEER